MTESSSIKQILADPKFGACHVRGWVRTARRSKSVTFAELNDGSCLKGLQLVFEPGSSASYEELATQISTGVALEVQGELVASPAKGQSCELKVASAIIHGAADPESYPLQKKGHSLEFLREILHLRARTNTFGAVFRIRSFLSFAIHRFFNERNFIYLNSPIITSSDCEGAGEMFRVTALNLDKPPKLESGLVDYSKDFFAEPVQLTVSGQLEGEVFASALGNIYTFGPTFRAENSNTARHLAEFWMVEPEMAFCNLQADYELASEFVQFLIREALQNCQQDLEFLAAREWCEKGHLEALAKVAHSKFEVMDYCKAVEVLMNSGRKFEFPVSWGIDLQTEHERYLTDEYIKGPLVVINYPKQIKAFYMRLNDDNRTVAAMDVLVPRLGEIVGGSQREDRLPVLEQRMLESNLELESYWWYLELRKYGSVPHAGFGLGFERLVMYLTGMQNIRDVIPFPRVPGFAKF